MSENKKENLLKLGECHKPHGIRGEFSFHLYNREDSSLSYVKDIVLFPKNEHSTLAEAGEHFKIKKINFTNKVIARLENVESRNKVEEMIPFEIYIDKKDLKKEEGEYFLNDLIGLKVLDLDENEIGEVENFYDNGVQEILVIKGKTPMEIPVVDQFIKEVNTEEGFIKIKPVEFI
jgi:16S rRNA processing protein RimM